MTPTPNRRWSFTLRTLFVVVTAFACWLGYELNWVRQRRAIVSRADIRASEDGYLEPPPVAPRFLGLFGEHAYHGITIVIVDQQRLEPNGVWAMVMADDKRLTQQERDEMEGISRLFPEATICAWITLSPLPKTSQ